MLTCLTEKLLILTWLAELPVAMLIRSFQKCMHAKYHS